MNYTIKTNTGVDDFTIGTQLFTSTAIDLVTLACLDKTNRSEFTSKVDNNDLVILKNDVPISNAGYIVSNTLQLSLGLSDLILLQIDWIEKEELDEMSVSASIAAIDIGYVNKRKAGKIYSRKKAAQIVYKILSSELTSDEGFEIEEATTKAQTKLESGHWKSALKYIEGTTIAGAYTQTIKDEYITEITDYITNYY